MTPIPETPPPVINVPKPAQGGWAPPSWFPPIVGACVGGGLGAVGAIVSALEPGDALDPRKLVGAFLVGCATGITGYLGIKSAGVRKL